MRRNSSRWSEPGLCGGRHSIPDPGLADCGGLYGRLYGRLCGGLGVLATVLHGSLARLGVSSSAVLHSGCLLGGGLCLLAVRGSSHSSLLTVGGSRLHWLAVGCSGRVLVGSG